MSQILAMPINRAYVTVGYKADAPKYGTLGAGVTHYGIDLTGTPNPIYASGTGVVVDMSNNAGNVVGRWLIIKYTDVAVYGDLIVRYYHLQTLHVKKGDKVNLDTKIATYGNTGRYSTGAHLHVEVDRDTAHPYHTPTLTGANGGLFAGLRGGGDTTVNPLAVFALKMSPPERQTVVFNRDSGFAVQRTLNKF